MVVALMFVVTILTRVHVVGKEAVLIVLGLITVFLVCLTVLDQVVMAQVQVATGQVTHTVVTSRVSHHTCILVVHVTAGNTTDIQQVLQD